MFFIYLRHTGIFIWVFNFHEFAGNAFDELDAGHDFPPAEQLPPEFIENDVQDFLSDLFFLPVHEIRWRFSEVNSLQAVLVRLQMGVGHFENAVHQVLEPLTLPMDISGEVPFVDELPEQNRLGYVPVGGVHKGR